MGRGMLVPSPGGPGGSGQGYHGPFVFCRKPVVCGVSSLGIDHTSLLGDTMEKIAWQKGGIFKVTRQPQGGTWTAWAWPLRLREVGLGRVLCIPTQERSWASVGSRFLSQLDMWLEHVEPHLQPSLPIKGFP